MCISFARFLLKNWIFYIITTVLNVRKREGLAEWRKRVGEDVANYIARTAATRGTKVHKMCEDFLNNEEVVKDNREFLPWCLFQQMKPVLEQKLNNIYQKLLENHKILNGARIGYFLAIWIPIHGREKNPF